MSEETPRCGGGFSSMPRRPCRREAAWDLTVPHSTSRWHACTDHLEEVAALVRRAFGREPTIRQRVEEVA